MNLKEHLQHPVFRAVSELSPNHPAYAVGGFVRDLLLGRPCKDIDIVVVGSGIELAEACAKYLGVSQEVAVFKNFGTAMFHQDGYEIEFVGARKESYESHSRKPAVENGSLQDDQNRRDFTINAMAISLNKENYGELVDPFDGQEDLKKKNIQTPLDPDITFSDDPLRMLRAIRFATQLNFDIAPETFESIQRNAERVKILSAERIAEELNKILLAPKPSLGFKLLDISGILGIIFPELIALKGTESRNGRSHKDNFLHTLEVVDNVAEKSSNLWLRWAALLHDIAKPQTKRFEMPGGWTFHGHEFIGSKMVSRIFKRMRLPLNEKMKYVEKLVALHLRPIVLAEDIVTDSAVRRLLFEAGDDIDDLMLLCNADITSKNREKVKRYHDNFKLVSEKLVELEEKDRIRNFQPPVTGEDIMKHFNIPPCREVGIIKDRIKDAILDGEIPNNFDAAWKLMLDEGGKLFNG